MPPVCRSCCGCSGGQICVDTADYCKWHSVTPPPAILPIPGIAISVKQGSDAVSSVTVTNGGTGWSGAPTVTFFSPTGGGATATAATSGGAITSVTVTNGGSGYTVPPTVTFSGGGGGSGATATANVSAGGGTTVDTCATTSSVASVSFSAGSGWTSAPTVTIDAAPGGGVTATATAAVSGGHLTAITITNSGSGYTDIPTVSLSGGGGTGSNPQAVMGPAECCISIAAAGLYSIYTTSSKKAIAKGTVTAGGSGYSGGPTATITGGGGSGATANVGISTGAVTSITITNGGSGYTSTPTITITGTGSGATASLTMTDSIPTVATINATCMVNTVTLFLPYYALVTVKAEMCSTGTGLTSTAVTASVGSTTIATVNTDSTGLATFTNLLPPGVTYALTATDSLGRTTYTPGSITLAACPPGITGNATLSHTVTTGYHCCDCVDALKTTLTLTDNRYSKTVTLTNGGASACTGSFTSFWSGTAVIQTGKVLSVTMTNGGSGYVGLGTVSFSGGGGTGCAGHTTGFGSISGVVITNNGSGYTSAPTVTFGGPGTGAAGTANLDSVIASYCFCTALFGGLMVSIAGNPTTVSQTGQAFNAVTESASCPPSAVMYTHTVSTIASAPMSNSFYDIGDTFTTVE
jgi:hypothetical protein